ncbi:MAG: hypothetical protein AAGB51_00540 [Planctomycetota bacterium]
MMQLALTQPRQSGPSVLITPDQAEQGARVSVATREPGAIPAQETGSAGGAGVIIAIPLIAAPFILAFVLWRRVRWLRRPAADRAFERLSRAHGYSGAERREVMAQAIEAGTEPLAALLASDAKAQTIHEPLARASA